MAVIDEYYSSRLELGPPAMVAYMAGFMGERERMNRAIIDQMLATSDPAALAERERDARKALNDLLKLKAQAQVAGGKANVDIIKALLQYKGAERRALASERGALTAARATVAKSYLYQENRKQQAIEDGRQAAALGAGIVNSAASQSYATEQAQVNGYQTALKSASENAGVGKGNLVNFAGKAATLKLAEDALAAARAQGHTAAAAWIKQTYFDNKEPSTFYQESDFRPKTEEEVLAEVAKVPSGGVGGLANIAKVIEGELQMDPGELGKLVYGTVKIDGKTLEQQYGPPSEDAINEAAGAAVASATVPAGAPTSDIDVAIADVKAQIEQMQSQRGKRPSLQEIAASRYPNYLYTNPFQVRSRGFDQFQEELARLSPRGRERYMEAMGRAPEVLPSVFARRDLERTEPAEIPVEGFRFAEEGVDTSALGTPVVSTVADLLKKTQDAFSQPQTIGGDEVQFVMRDGKAAVQIKKKDGKTVYAPAGSETYTALAQQIAEKAPEVSGLKAYMDKLPDSIGEQELAPVYAALTKGGYSAAEAEARKLAEAGGDVGLHEVYARELEDVAREPDPVKRSDKLESLRTKIPEGVSWGPSLQRVLDASTIETATTGAQDLSRALRDAFPEGLAADRPGEVATRFETRAAQEREKERQRKAPLPETELPTVESIIGEAPSSLAPKAEKDAYAKKKAGLDTLRKNNKAAYLDLVREERATRGANLPGALVQGAERVEVAQRPAEGKQLRTLTPEQAGAQQARGAVVSAKIAALEGSPETRSAGPLPAQEDLWADLSATMLSPLKDTPEETAFRAAREQESVARFLREEPEAARAGGTLARARDARFTPTPAALPVPATSTRAPGRAGPLPRPRASMPVTAADLAAADALVASMPVPTAPARTSTKATGTFGDAREKKTPPPATKKTRQQQQAEEDAAALD